MEINTKELILQTLRSRPVAYRRDFALIGGGALPGLFLSQLFYWHDKGHDPDGWIDKTQKEWFDELGLTRSEQETARSKLMKNGLIEEDRTLKGKRYRPVIDKIIQMLESSITKCQNSAYRNGVFKHSSISENTTKSTSGDGTNVPIKDSNLVKAYMDKQEADGMEPLRPSPAEIGMLKTMASKGVTSQELPKLIDNCFVDKKYSVDYLLKNIVSLRAKVIESKKDKRAEWYAPKKYKYKSVCDCGGFEEFHFDAKAEWCWRCNKRAKLFEVETGKQIIYGK